MVLFLKNTVWILSPGKARGGGALPNNEYNVGTSLLNPHIWSTSHLYSTFAVKGYLYILHLEREILQGTMVTVLPLGPFFVLMSLYHFWRQCTISEDSVPFFEDSVPFYETNVPVYTISGCPLLKMYFCSILCMPLEPKNKQNCRILKFYIYENTILEDVTSYEAVFSHYFCLRVACWLVGCVCD